MADGEVEGQPSAQSDGELADGAVGGGPQVRVVDGAGPTEHGLDQREVVPHGQVGPQAHPLGDVAEASAGLARRWAVHELDGAGGRSQQPEQDPDGGGLAGAVGPEQPDHLPRRDREVQVGEHLLGP